MVDDTVTLLMYVPFVADGLDRTMESMKAEKFSCNWSTSKDTRPMGA
jgi:hypothetical protein